MLLNHDRAIEVMARNGLDALVATTPENVYYVSDYGTAHLFQFGRELQGIACAVLPRRADAEPTLIVPEWELPHLVGCSSWMPGLRVQTGFDVNVDDLVDPDEADRRLVELIRRGREEGGPNRMELLARTLGDLGLKDATVGFDDVRVMQTVATMIPLDSRDAVNDFLTIRMVKTQPEIDALRKSVTVLEGGIRSVVDRIAVGTTAGELMTEIRTYMARQGGFVSHMTGGGVTYPWISQPNMDYRYQYEDVIQIDPTGHYRWYWADIGRVVTVGEVSQKLRTRFERLRACQEAAQELLRPGAHTGAIKQRMRSIAETVMPKGFNPMLHLIGLNQNDNPQTLGGFEDDDFTLEAGMVVNVEAPYFEVGWAVLQLEESYLVSDSGAERLSTLPHEIITCG